MRLGFSIEHSEVAPGNSSGGVKDQHWSFYGLYGFNLGLGPLRYTHRYPPMIHRLHSYISLDTTNIFPLLLVKNYIYMYGQYVWM